MRVAVGVSRILHLLALFTVLLAYQVNRDENIGELAALNTLNSILDTSQSEFFVILVMDKNITVNDVGNLRAPWGVSVFEVAADSLEANITQVEVSQIVIQARQLQQVSRSLVVVVMSDDPIFLGIFTEWSYKAELLVWTTRLILFTGLPLHRLLHLRPTLAMTNSILLQMTSSDSFSVYMEHPFGTLDTPPLKIASGNSRTKLPFKSRQLLFPDKFYKLENNPGLRVGYIPYSTTKKVVVEDPDAPGGKRVQLLDAEVTLLESLAKRMNFKIVYSTPPDMSWGTKLSNGEWNGIIGMMMRGELDLSQSLFHMKIQRAEVVDFTFPVTIWYTRSVIRRGSPEVDPWGFLLPLSPLVWVALVTALLGVVAVMVLLPYCLPHNTMARTKLDSTTFNCLRVLLQEDVSSKSVRKWWWWERVVLGVWMLVMLVVIQSYAGNLISFLTVRYIPLPIQSLQDVLDHPSITFLVPGGTSGAEAFFDAKGGIFREVGDLQYVGRINTYLVSESVATLDTLVRRGDHVLNLLGTRTSIMIAQDFSDKGRCDFYHAREEILPMIAGFVGPKGSPLVPALSRRLMMAAESGLYYHWLQLYTPNFTSCLKAPTKVLIRTPLGIANTWGTLVVLGGGMIISLFVFFLEILWSYFI